MLGEILPLKKYIIKIADWSLPFTYGPLNITAEDGRKIIKRLRWRKNKELLWQCPTDTTWTHLRLNLMNWWTSDGSNELFSPCLVQVLPGPTTPVHKTPLCASDFLAKNSTNGTSVFRLHIGWDLSGQRWCWLSYIRFHWFPESTCYCASRGCNCNPRKHRKGKHSTTVYLWLKIYRSKA